ncbi:MAG TPA: phosphatase PAP2 family protein [Acidobacteriota bacterium]|nr:phosphatase PAP2 family protein [Acidobacteriota bacterium]
MDFTYDWSLPTLLALAYVAVHACFLLAARHPPPQRGRWLAADLLLAAGLSGLLWYGYGTSPGGRPLHPFLRLWGPVIFYWWAYTWAGRVLFVFHASHRSWDGALIRWEGRLLGQPSLWMARYGGRPGVEIMQISYASYYLYTPVIGAALHLRGRFEAFEAMSFAVLLGYLVSYSCYSLMPVWGPRWGLVKEGLLEERNQLMRGYAVTAALNRLMYGGLAHKGGAMPSGHASTAVIFAVWCGRLWGWEGLAAGWLIALAMMLASIYGRYHYVADVAAGALLGWLSLLCADALFPHAALVAAS